MLGRSLIVALFAGAAVPSMALMSPVATADDADDSLIALMMGGTAMPTPSEFWQNGIITDYIDPATGGSYTPVLVSTPESFSSTSVSEGLADLQAAMDQHTAPYLVEGYSQSAVIAVDEEIALMQSGQAPPDATFLLLGSLNRPDGGLFERFPVCSSRGYRRSSLTARSRSMPVFQLSTSRPSTTSSPISHSFRSTRDLNAILGIYYAHGAYGEGLVPKTSPHSGSCRNR